MEECYNKNSKEEFLYSSRPPRKEPPETLFPDETNEEEETSVINDTSDRSDKYDTTDVFEEERENTEDKEISPEDTPTISEEKCKNLPKILSVLRSFGKNERQKDLLLLSGLIALGGCMSTVYGYYDGMRCFPHSYLSVTAGAAQGKGVISCVLKVLSKYDELIFSKSEMAVKQSQVEIEQWEKQVKNDCRQGKKAAFNVMPKKAEYQSLIYPANVSGSSLVKSLYRNAPRGGVMFVQETDGLINANKAECGHFSPVLRQVAEHELIGTAYEKDGPKPWRVKCPKLALVISGTWLQTINFFGSTENGLFSRFLHYLYEVDEGWRDVSPHGDNNKEELLEQLADDWCPQAEALDQRKLEIKLPSTQWAGLNDTFSKLMEESRHTLGVNYDASVKRHGKMVFRLCMTLTALRECENPTGQNTRQCSDEDFETAMECVCCCLEHSKLISRALTPKAPALQLKAPTMIEEVFNRMPNIFTTTEMSNQCKSLFERRKVLRYLNENKGILVKKIKSGSWAKITKK